MTRSRFGFQTALLAGCLSLLAVGCGDDGTTAMAPGPGDTPDPCEDLPNPQSTNPDCDNYQAPEPPPAPKPVFGLSEDHLLKGEKSLRNNANKALRTLATHQSAGTSAFFTFMGTYQRGVGGINAVNKPARPERVASTADDTAPFVIPILTDMKRNDDGELDYNLNFIKYNNYGGDSNTGWAIRFDAGESDLYTRSPQVAKAYELLGRGDNQLQRSLDSPRGDLDFVLKPSEETKINSKLNLDYLKEAGLDDSMYTVHVLEKETSLNDVEGTLYVELLTNHSNKKTDTDYLVGGVWMHVPSDGELDNFKVGGFADGKNYYETGITPYLTGEATYTGKAIGFHGMGGDSNMIQRLTGDVKITANFGVHNGDDPGAPRQYLDRGWVEGSLMNIKLDGKDPSGASNLITLPRITMPDADESTNDDTNFDLDDPSGARRNPVVIGLEAETRLGQIGGESYSGSWGVAFFGNQLGDWKSVTSSLSEYGNDAIRGNNKERYPNGLAGMVKGTSSNNAFVASFIAEQD